MLKRFREVSILFLVIFMGIGVFRTSNAALPEYTCLKAKTAVVIDGDLSDPAWQKAEKVSFSRTETSIPTNFPTTGMMTWDDSYLYIAWDSKSPDVWTTKFTKDTDLWNEEVVEIFIDPGAIGKNFLELEVNPANTIVDLNVAKPFQGDVNWDIQGLKTAVIVNGTLNDHTDQDVGWTTEIAIPWASMKDIQGVSGPPNDGTQWRINLYRIARPWPKNASKDEYLAWSPTGAINFHMPDKFGIVRFSVGPTSAERTFWGKIKASFR